MISHFVEPNRPIVTFYMRGEKGDTWKSLASLPAGRLTGKPLYVLTGGRSASAAEEFIGHVGGFKVGELVGETTAGAGYRNEFFPVVGRLRDQRFGWARGARIDRQGLGEGRDRSDHQGRARKRRSKSRRCTRFESWP